MHIQKIMESATSNSNLFRNGSISIVAESPPSSSPDDTDQDTLSWSANGKNGFEDDEITATVMNATRCNAQPSSAATTAAAITTKVSA